MRVFSRKNIVISFIFLFFYLLILIMRNTGLISNYYEIVLIQISINIILACSLNLIAGFTGQFSLGHAGFMSIGAYLCALVTLRIPTMPGFAIGTVVGAFTASIVGIIIGIPTLRLKGDYLTIATLGMSEIIRVTFLNMKATNGAAGLMNIPRLVDWKLVFIITVLTVILIRNFITSKHGRACISIREDEIAAESIGINITMYKTMAFAIGAFFAGIAGSIYASYFYFLKPGLFDFQKSIDMLAIVVLGGLGSITGSIAAAILLTLISSLLQNFPSIRMIIYAVMLIAIMLFRPQGLMGTKEFSQAFQLFHRKRAIK